MKVLIVGYCKTGTTTVERALELLGYNISTYMRNASELYEDWKIFQNGNGQTENLISMFKGYDVAGGTPSNIYWRNFLEAYPDIKLIFMTRPEDDWLRSFLREMEVEEKEIPSFYRIFSQKARRFYKFTLSIQFLPQEMKRGVSNERLKETFRKHNQDILKNAPKNQLLMFNLHDGWKPLCEFLQVETPNIPFPHENKKNNWFAKLVNQNPFCLKMKSEAWKNFSLLCFAAVGITATVAWSLFRNNSQLLS